MSTTPTDARELYDLLMQTPDLCGRLTIENNFLLRWDLWEGYYLGIFFSGKDNQISLNKRGALLDSSVTHWHPASEEILDELLSIGRKGNLLVIRRGWLFEAVAHMGPAEECPRRATRKSLFSRPLILKAQ